MKTKCKNLVLVFVAGAMLIQIKNQSYYSFNTLVGDWFGDFLKIFQFFNFIFSKPILEKLKMTKNYRMAFILACQVLEHSDQ